MQAIGPHLGEANPLPTLDASAQAFRQEDGNPLARAMAADQAAHAAGGVRATLGELVTNPLNLTGPAGEAGQGLRATRDGLDALGSYVARNPTALERGLGTALEGASVVGRAAMLPYEAGFGALGGMFRGAKNALAPAASEAAPALASAADTGAALASPGTPAVLPAGGQPSLLDQLRGAGQLPLDLARPSSATGAITAD